MFLLLFSTEAQKTALAFKNWVGKWNRKDFMAILAKCNHLRTRLQSARLRTKYELVYKVLVYNHLNFRYRANFEQRVP